MIRFIVPTSQPPSTPFRHPLRKSLWDMNLSLTQGGQSDRPNR